MPPNSTTPTISTTMANLHNTYKTTPRSQLISSKLNQIRLTHYKINQFSSTQLTSASYNQPNDIQKLYHKDWLSPNEVVKIFNSLQPNSILPMLDHISKRKDYKPTESLYNVIITKLAYDKNFTAIENLLKLIKTQKSLNLSDGFFYDLIKVYGNVGGLINGAVEILYEMKEYNCWPSSKTFNFVLNLLVNSRRFELVSEVFADAKKLGVEVDACGLNIMIKGLCKCGRLEDALQVLDEFPEQECRPNKMTYCTIMHCMCEKGMVDEAFGLLDKMEKEGISPDAVTFNVLVSGLRKLGRVDEALELLDRMKVIGCDPNKGTYQEVLYGFLEARRFVDAKNMVKRMRSRSLIPSYSSYKSLVRGLCEEGLLGDVEWVLKSMVLVGFVPKMGMWKEVLQKTFSRKNAPLY